MFFNPSDCGSCSPPPPRKPNCQVCEWATAQTAAYGYDLCWEDFKTLAQVEKITEQRIIKLLESELSQEMSESAGYIMTDDNYPVRWPDLIALIKGEQK